MTIVRLKPRSSAAWHRYRGQDVTASVIGALFGVHEWVSPYELWALKSGRLTADPEETPAIKRGRLLEPVAVQLLREMRPTWEIVHNTGPGDYFRDKDARLGGTPDVLAIDPERGNGVVQIKSVESSTYRRKWLDADGLVEPPFWISLQAATEAYLTGSRWAAVAPLVVGHGIDMPIIDVPLIPGVIDRIKDETRAFWKMVESGEEPLPDFSRDADVIERLYAQDEGEEIDLSRDNQIFDLIASRARLKAAAKDCHTQVAAIDAEIKHKMQGATIGHLPGGRKITWRAQRRAGFYTPPASFRVLRVPQPDEGGPSP